MVQNTRILKMERLHYLLVILLQVLQCRFLLTWPLTMYPNHNQCRNRTVCLGSHSITTNKQNTQTRIFSPTMTIMFNWLAVASPPILRELWRIFDTSDPLRNHQVGNMGSLQDGNVLNSNCNTGDECWGTNIYDFDNDYTSDNNTPYSASMMTPAMEVTPQRYIAKFSSWHGFHYNVSGSNTYYYDCGYVMVRNSSSPYFPPPNILFGVTFHLTIKILPVSDFQTVCIQLDLGNGRIQSCDSLSGLDYALAANLPMLHRIQQAGLKWQLIS